MITVQSVLIAASAGTGKTYQLATRYLALLALNGIDSTVGAGPEQIIAITFTRKAAGEFRERILHDLACGAASENGAAALRQRLLDALENGDERPGIAPGSSALAAPRLTRGFFLGLLRAMMASYSRLALCTIDSLFARMAGSLAYEMGYSGFAIMGEDEAESERRHALAQVYRAWSRDPEVYREMERVFVQSLRGERGLARAEEKMFQLVRDYHEIYLDCPREEQWGAPEGLGLSPSDAEPVFTTEQLAEKALALQALLPDAVKVGRTDYGKRYRAFLDAVATMAPKAHLDCSADDYGCLLAEAPEKHPCPRLHDELRQLLAQCLPLELQRALTRTQSAYRLVRQFDSLYRAYVRNRGKFCFHDVTRMLSRGEMKRWQPLIEERMDARYNHWLLDEFQDTSRTQWNVLEPFLREIAQDNSGTRSLFVVGDAKQSIYQWRGGDVRLLRELRESEPWQSRLAPMQLATSFRSAPPVLDMVNAVCAFAATAPHAAPGALAGWSCPPHRSARPDRSGCAQVWEAEASPECPGREVDACVARLLKEILPPVRAAGLSCALLVPSSKDALRVADYVSSYAAERDLDLPVEVCDDAAVGIDTPLGKGLAHFFHYLLCPGNSAVRNDLAALPLRPVLDRPWTYWKGLLDARGYAAVLRSIGEIMREEPAWRDMTPFVRSRWALWLEEADAFDLRGGAPEEWLRRMESLKRRIEPGNGTVQVMTIHKSKGLGFDVVLLPCFPPGRAFADDRHMRLRNEDESDVLGMLHDDNRLLYESVNPLRELAERWRSRQDAEGFCQTYVALTRAARAIYAVVPPPAKSKRQAPSKTSMKEILRLTPGESVPAGWLGGYARNIASFGDPDWFRQLAAAPERGRAACIVPACAPLTLPARLQRLSPSAERVPATKPGEGMERPRQPEMPVEFSPSLEREEAPLLPRDTGEAAAFGSRVHAVLASWESLPAEMPAELDDALRRELSFLWEIPALGALLTPKPGDLVYCEQNVEAVDERASVWTSAVIDRLTLHADGTATVVDFKTGRGLSAEQMRARYGPQMQTYRRLVHAACGMPEESVRLVLVATRLRQAIVLD